MADFFHHKDQPVAPAPPTVSKLDAERVINSLRQAAKDADALHIPLNGLKDKLNALADSLVAELPLTIEEQKTAVEQFQAAKAVGSAKP